MNVLVRPDGRIVFTEGIRAYVTDDGGSIDRFIQVSDVFKAAQHRMHLTAFAVGGLCGLAGFVVGWFVFAC